MLYLIPSWTRAIQARALVLDRSIANTSVKTCYSVILHTPFAPFTVLLCYAIEKSDEAELARLDTFVASLQSACSISESVAELHHLCRLLYNAARLCISRKNRTPPQAGKEPTGSMPVNLRSSPRPNPPMAQSVPEYPLEHSEALGR